MPCARYRYRFGRRPLPFFTIHYVRTSACILEAHGYGRKIVVPPDTFGEETSSIAHDSSCSRIKHILGPKEVPVRRLPSSVCKV